MGKRITRLAIIDIGPFFPEVVEVDGKVRNGECLRCGKCCSDCEHLIQDSFWDHKQTKPIYSCGLGHKKPIRCNLYPLPEDKHILGCGIYWESK